jgi:hypothetical protein
LRRVSDATTQTEYVFAEELISEGWSARTSITWSGTRVASAT